MNHRISPSDLREQLVYQLVVLGEEKNHFLDTFFAIPGKERLQMDQLLSKYTAVVESMLALPDEGLHTNVLIGSQVTVAFLDDQTTETFTIVYPDDADPSGNCISFLSPLGKQLLLAAKADELAIETPAGMMQVRIENIQFTGFRKSAEGHQRLES